jgi:cellulase
MKSYLLALALPALTAAHGHVEGVIADGKWYQGWNAAFKYNNPIPKTVGFQADNLDNGFVSPDAFGTVDIVCHKSAKFNGAYVSAKPGSKVTFLWDTWPVSHKGPVFDYIAPCNGDCGAASLAGLKWDKMDQGAWLTGNDPGTWVTDNLIKNNVSWTTTIPSNLAAGNYVIRHEIIALHAAGQTNGAQAYPQCVSFTIDGSGTNKLGTGVAATTFYKASDPGILFNLYTKFTGYTIPGPSLAKFSKRETREHVRDWVQ